MEVVDIAAEVDELHRALRRLDVDVVLLYDALGGTPVLDLARDLSSAYPEIGLILLAAEEPGLLRAAMQAGLRDVVAFPIALESFESSVRAAAQWSRTMRDRVAGEESAGARARRPAGRDRRLQGRRRHDHDRAAPRARLRPDGAGAADLPRRLRPPEGRLPRAAGHAAPAQRRRPRRGRPRDLRPSPAGDALHAQGGLPAAARARGGRDAPRTSTPPSRATCWPRSRRATR